jgi:predicted AAA+ superfamily ATPase
MGGFPEFLEEKDDDYLRTLLRDIITRDIAVRRKITNENQLIRCDFLIKQNEKIVQAIQVCWEINNDNMVREINGIKNAMAETGALEGTIVTNNQEDNLDGIDLIPAWKWI